MKTKGKLTPFDAELKAMIADQLGVQPEVRQEEDFFFVIVDKLLLTRSNVQLLEYAVLGRVGKRLTDVKHTDEFVVFQIAYSAESATMPDLCESWDVAINPFTGANYTPKGGNVKAVKVTRDNIDELEQFTGGGSMEILREMGATAFYSFLSPNGTFIDVPEGMYIIRDKNQHISIYTEHKFIEEYELRTEETMLQGLNKLFGMERNSRFKKLTEEFAELSEAHKALNKDPDNDALKEAYVNELSDLFTVLYHIIGIDGFTPEDMLSIAKYKIRNRAKDPNFKRDHPHIERVCRNCTNFAHEDNNGLGTCKVNNETEECNGLCFMHELNNGCQTSNN